jgi:SAM-dependent methyltransferase
MTGHAETTSPPQAEFDNFAVGYSAGMDNPVTAMLGASADDFVAVKLRHLLRRFPGLRSGAPSVLDYGCGTATLLRLMARELPRAKLMGCDISAGMLQEAQRLWPAEAARPALHLQDGALTPLRSGSCDLVVISAVLHHVPPADRPGVHAEIFRVLRPGGHVIVFEHNPRNPVTRYIVAHAKIDRNAILLDAEEAQASLAAAGFTGIDTRYMMFAPPRLNFLRGIDDLLGWLPLGAQYATTAVRPGAPA